MKKRNGFTFVELIIVIVIAAIVFTVIVPFLKEKMNSSSIVVEEEKSIYTKIAEADIPSEFGFFEKCYHGKIIVIIRDDFMSAAFIDLDKDNGKPIQCIEKE